MVHAFAFTSGRLLRLIDLKHTLGPARLNTTTNTRVASPVPLPGIPPCVIREQPFYMLSKELFPGTFCPTPTHFFLKLLADKGKLLRVFTQNIDSLEHIAGLPKDKIVAAHGNFDSAHCQSRTNRPEPQCSLG